MVMLKQTPAAGSVVVITGASAGVGRATAEAFAGHGCKVALLARGQAGLDGAAESVRAAGGEPLALPVDVGDPEAVERAADQVERELGPIDVWVNNATATIFSPLKDIAASEYRRSTEVTYLGTVYGTLAALRHMLPRDRGAIVQVGSALAYRAIPLQSPYCGAKHAIQGFTESLRCELLHDRSQVHVTMVQLPAINSPQFDWSRNRMPKRPQPVPPIFQPEVAARAIVWASQHRRKEVWVGGPAVKAILADRVASSLADRYLARTGYRSQLTQEPEQPGRPDNLYEPLDDEVDHGAHGRFRDTHERSRGYWSNIHRDALTTAAALAGGLAVAAGLRARR
jgi:NAD(P)-dependent dehydrogenase (short-subunit alcohol dehydrogenase family)